MKKIPRTQTLRVRVTPQLRASLQAIADNRDLDLSDILREALTQYVPATLREHAATSYSAPPPPPIKARRAAISQAIPTAFYAVERPKSAS